ncbi:MAG: hypothetical protein LBQ60_01055 [Bacteroidales bacterium]|jgi:uncharacterized protein (UPF0297 family)|nr:hypothetical protein [Bacteroidales bacterium]
MPEYFLILAEEFGADAYLATSPQHFFIKIKDNKGYWHNLELTCGAIINDQNYLNSGFIKAEALRNKVYLEPMARQQVIAEVMIDLARNYIRKYGYDTFVQRCIDTSLKYHPNNIRAYQIQANYHTARAMYVIERTGVLSPDKLPECPQAYRMYQTMHQSYKALDDLGYEEMPQGVYQAWLNRVNEEKEKPENKRNKLQLQQIIQ